MGLFSKNKEVGDVEKLNELLSIALEMNHSTGTWSALPESAPLYTEKVIGARKLVFEYIRQLKEAKVYSNGAVKKFSKEEFSWVSKENVKKFIELGQFL